MSPSQILWRDARVALATALAAAALAGCGSGGESAPDGRASAADARIERCVDRLLSRATAGGGEEAVRRYARDTYCARFEQNGWIYDDGALRIAAHEWLETAGACETATAGKPPRTVPCRDLRIPGEPIECALLHHVRRSEVSAFLAERQRTEEVRCDDSTPLAELGVP